MQPYIETRSTHKNTHTFLRCRCSIFLAHMVQAILISEGHINIVAVGLLVFHGKQRVSTCCVIFYDTLYSEARYNRPMRTAQTGCHTFSLIVSPISKTIMEVRGFQWLLLNSMEEKKGRNYV